MIQNSGIRVFDYYKKYKNKAVYAHKIQLALQSQIAMWAYFITDMMVTELVIFITSYRT
mgnify:CR=1 FL=1